MSALFMSLSIFSYFYPRYFCIFAGGIAVALLTAGENALAMWIGIVIAVFTLITGLLTTWDIAKLQKQLQWRVLTEECDDKTEYPDVTGVLKK